MTFDPPRTFLWRALFGTTLVIYTALVAEAYFRVFDPQPLMPRYVTGTAWGVRGNIPNARYWNHTEEVDVEYRINGQGLRADRDFPWAKPAGTCRIAVFGDSFFFGIELDLKDTFEGQLERRLRDGGFRADVLNFAVGGFGTAEMLQTFDKFGRQFHPDIVLFSWDNSDLQDNVRSGLYRLDAGRLQRANSEYLPGVKTANWLMQFGLYRLIADHSEFYSFARERIEFLVKRHQRRADREKTNAARPDEAAPNKNAVPNGEAAPNENAAPHGEAAPNKNAVPNGEAAPNENAAPHGEAAPNEDAAPNGEAAPESANAEQKRRAGELAAALLLQTDDLVDASGASFYLVELPWKVSRTIFTSSIDDLPAAARSKIKIVRTAAALSKAARPDLKLYFETGQGHLTPTGESILAGETFKSIASAPQLASCAAAGRVD